MNVRPNIQFGDLIFVRFHSFIFMENLFCVRAFVYVFCMLMMKNASKTLM